MTWLAYVHIVWSQIWLGPKYLIITILICNIVFLSLNLINKICSTYDKYHNISIHTLILDYYLDNFNRMATLWRKGQNIIKSLQISLLLSSDDCHIVDNCLIVFIPNIPILHISSIQENNLCVFFHILTDPASTCKCNIYGMSASLVLTLIS